MQFLFTKYGLEEALGISSENLQKKIKKAQKNGETVSQIKGGIEYFNIDALSKSRYDRQELKQKIKESLQEQHQEKENHVLNNFSDSDEIGQLSFNFTF